MASLKPRITMFVFGFSVLILLVALCVFSFVTKHIMRPSPIDLKARTVSTSFEARKEGETTTLVIDILSRGTYEVGFEFPLQKLPRGKSFDGLLRVEVFEDGNRILTRDVSGKKRGYFEDADSYRAIALADFELPIDEKTREVKLVASVLRVDATFNQYQDIRLFVRPVPVK